MRMQFEQNVDRQTVVAETVDVVVLIDRALLLSGKSMCRERSPGKYASTSLGFISQIASVLESVLTMLTLERKKDARHLPFLSPISLVWDTPPGTGCISKKGCDASLFCGQQ